MKFGIVFPDKAEYADPDLAVKSAVLAEELGFDFFLTWDHYMYGAGEPSLDSWIFLTHIAAKTDRIRFGTCVTPIPFRPPGILAKMVASLDVLSNGRVILGVGAGWHRPEFEAFSAWDDAATRVSKTKEGLQLMTRLWTQPSVNFEGRFYRAKEAFLEPKPVQKPYPPLWFGSTRDRMLRLTAKYGSGWIPAMVSPPEYAAGASTLSRLLGESGRQENDFTFVYNQFDPLQTAKEYADSIQAFGAAGCGSYIVNWKYPKDEYLERLRWFAREVKGSFA